MEDPISALGNQLSRISTRACSRRALLASLALLGLYPLLQGCSADKPMTIAMHPWPGYELLFLAERQGWLCKNCVRLRETTSASVSLQALHRGEVDGAALTLDEMLTARNNGLPLTAVLVFDISSGADKLMVRPEIRSLPDLAGKRIGVEQNALGALLLQLTLQAGGLQLNQLEVVNLPIDRHLESWQTTYLDAVITYEPQATRLAAAGAQILLDSRRFPGMILDVLAIRTELLDAGKECLRSLTAGHFRALQHLRQNPQDAAYRIADQMRLSPHQVLDTFRELELPSLESNRQYLGGSSPKLLKAATMLHQIMLDNGLIRRIDPFTNLVSDRFLPKEDA